MYLFIWLPHILVAAQERFRCDMRALVPWPEVETGSPALGAQSLTHWTTGEVSGCTVLDQPFSYALNCLFLGKALPGVASHGPAWQPSFAPSHRPPHSPRVPSELFWLHPGLGATWTKSTTEFHGPGMKSGTSKLLDEGMNEFVSVLQVFITCHRHWRLKDEK